VPFRQVLTQWDGQPQEAVSIRANISPWVSGILLPPYGTVSVDGQSLTQTSAPVTSNQCGLNYQGNGSSAIIWGNASRPLVIQAGARFTMVVQFRKVGTASDQNQIAGWGATTGSTGNTLMRLIGGLTAESVRLQLQLGNSGGGAIIFNTDSSNFSANNERPHTVVVAGVADAGESLTYWADGRQLNTVNAASAPAGATTFDLVSALAGRRGGASISFGNFEVSLAAMLADVRMADAWCAAASNAPYDALFEPQRIWVPVSTGSSDVTAPSVSASFAWAATASQPIVDTLAPAVGASITWAASAPVPLVDILAPSAAAAFAWAANASTPAIEDGAVVAPEVSSSFAWSATAAAPIVDVLAPGVSAAWTWQANPSAPIVQSDIAAPAVGAQVHWAAHALAPNIEGDHETIGSYDDAPWPSLPVRVRAAAPARFSWRANATRPRISVPPRPVAAPVAQATMRWTGSDARPRGLLLTRTGAPAAAPAAWPVRFCSHCGAPVERALH